MEYRLSSLTEFPPFPPLNTPPRTGRLIHFPVDRAAKRTGAAGLMRSYFDFSTSPRAFSSPALNRVLGSRLMESYAYTKWEEKRSVARARVCVCIVYRNRFVYRDFGYGIERAIISVSVDNGQLVDRLNAEINRTLALKTCPRPLIRDSD